MSKRIGRSDVRHSILNLLHEQPTGAAMTADEIASAIDPGGQARRRIRKVLGEMAHAGSIAAAQGNRYSIGRPTDLLEGRVEMARSGDGFVRPAGETSAVRIAQRDLGTALPGDRVLVRVLAEAGGQAPKQELRAGQVVRVVERAKRMIVGTLRSSGRLLHVVPLDPTYSRDLYVAETGGARPGDRVVAEFIKWDDPHLNPEARIVETIGPETKASLDTVAIVRQYGFEEEFPPAVLEEANEAASMMDRPGRRLDLRGKYIFTIDPATARDFDDALSLDTDSKGRRVLGVHIADVAHFVRTGGELDMEAEKRGNSVYFPDRVIPMLPEVLSNGSCSLAPNEDRLAFSVFMTVDEDGNPVNADFAKTIIRSKLRLTYEQALEILTAPAGVRPSAKGAGPEAVSLIRNIGRLAAQLRRRRMANHGLELDMAEYEVVLRPDGTVQEMRRRSNDISHQLVEECMIAANEAVDRMLSSRGLPLIRRIHEPPAEAKIELLTAQLVALGFQPGDLNRRQNLSAFLRSVEDNPLVYHVRTAVLRSMKKALYSPVPAGHYGLAKQYYAHFTSPIRRYPDLTVHRALAAAISSGGPPYPMERLDAIARSCSETERKAEEAERALIETKKYRLLSEELERKEPAVRDAVIVKVLSFGMFVEVVDLQVQGLVHISTIADSYVRFDATRETLRAGNALYRVGGSVRVFATKVDFDNRRIDFALERGAASGARAGGGTGRRGSGVDRQVQAVHSSRPQPGRSRGARRRMRGRGSRPHGR